jgi:hypothetical protein
VTIAGLVLSLISICAGCSYLSAHKTSSAESANDDQLAPNAPAVPATVKITYIKADDTLKSVTVTEYTGASVLRTRKEGEAEAVVVRFDGGVPVWHFHANRTLLNPLTEIASTPYHLASIDYGKVPAGFTQDVPEIGPPPPLDAGGYYVFAIERDSGVVSYQAVKVNADLSIQAYDADPRAGTSYKLCCNVSADFAEPSPSPDVNQAPFPVPPSPDSDQP